MKERLETAGTFERPIVDSELSLEEALRQNPESVCPPETLERQRVVPVTYLGLEDGLYHRGQIVIDRELEEDVSLLFERIVREGFPVARAIPVADPRFGWDDEVSMAENNTSAFNHRLIQGTTRLSNHALGRALDINPALNPYIDREGVVHPVGAVYDPKRPGTVYPDHFIVEYLESRGWSWGGSWKEVLDYHHFEKPK